MKPIPLGPAKLTNIWLGVVTLGVATVPNKAVGTKKLVKSNLKLNSLNVVNR
jgi:hypothetical protein